MPELPEVETVKEQLKKRLVGKKITKVDIYYSDIIEYPTILEFEKKITNQTIMDMKRRGKWLIFELNNYYLLSHLRMEGKYFFKTPKDSITKHEHVVFTLDNNTQLRYHDTRKFGKMHLIDKDKLEEAPPIKKLGLEPWDNNLNIDYLKNKYTKKNLPIKTVLLDQSIIVGIGNIYANEILFLSKINPYTPTSKLSEKDITNIINNTKTVLEKAIKLGGSTIKSYTSVDGMDGKFQNELLVHSKENSPCPICNTKITKVFIGGRGTYYCQNCQK